MTNKNFTPLEVKVKDPKQKKKEDILAFYADAPIKKWAAGSVGISEDTLSRWEKEDTDFAEDLIRLKVQYGKRRLGKAKNNEWVLERMFKEEFGEDKTPDKTTVVVIPSELIDKYAISSNTEDSSKG